MKKKGAFRYSGAMALFFIPYLLTAAVNGMETAILNRTPDLGRIYSSSSVKTDSR